MIQHPKYSLAILAGGKNSRFNGFNKSFVQIKGKPIIDWQIEETKGLFAEIIIVSNQTDQFINYPQCNIVSDKYIGYGPLAGIEAALFHAKSEFVFFIPCDAPFIDKALILKMIEYFEKESKEIVISKTTNFRQPLFGIYSKILDTQLADFLVKSQNPSILSFLQTRNYSSLYFEDNLQNNRNFYNVNTPDDLDLIEQLF